MSTFTPRKSPAADTREGAVGIVVRTDRAADERPRTVAFVWGQAVHAAPSLPFGRWKSAVRPAA